ncbi:MAG: ribosomal RNA small subunit methyltransferase A [Candidatus Cloacimonetes bacterium]|nr:ribosomal RNA small subunit methyltransferase A [Candidatus Cloacimonadota bacterium]
MFRCKKRLGQHFLKDKNIVRKIVNIADIQSDDFVWEIGPGKGILTEELLNHSCKLTCFEIDEKLYPIIEEKFSNRINLIKQDILKADWQRFFPENKVNIVANLPYQITTPFLFKVAENADKFSKVVIMIQREVAQRINAKVGTKNYGVLSLKMQFYFTVSYEFTVKPHLFYPPPKVDSAVISLIPRKDKPVIDNEKLFWNIIESSFRNRRKMLRNNLKVLISSERIDKLNFDLTKRGESLSEQDFLELYNEVKKVQSTTLNQ